MIRRTAVIACRSLALAGLLTAPALACENDGVPGFNHATGQFDAEPFAGAYADVADKVATGQREAAIERARTAFIARFDIDVATASIAAPAGVAMIAISNAPNARSN